MKEDRCGSGAKKKLDDGVINSAEGFTTSSAVRTAVGDIALGSPAKSGTSLSTYVI
jgi:hypothetical protein